MHPKRGFEFVLGDHLQNGRLDILDPCLDTDAFGVDPDLASPKRGSDLSGVSPGMTNRAAQSKAATMQHLKSQGGLMQVVVQHWDIADAKPVACGNAAYAQGCASSPRPETLRTLRTLRNRLQINLP